MQTTEEALKEGFKYIGERPEDNMATPFIHPQATIQKGYWSFKFSDGDNNYELCFEPLIRDNQMYVALYKDFSLLTNKVVVRPGNIKQEDE